MDAGMRLPAVALLVLCLAAMSDPSSAAPFVGELVMAQAEGVQPLGRVLPPVYRIKWLGEDGKVREVRVDARTGHILDAR